MGGRGDSVSGDPAAGTPGKRVRAVVLWRDVNCVDVEVYGCFWGDHIGCTSDSQVLRVFVGLLGDEDHRTVVAKCFELLDSLVGIEETEGERGPYHDSQTALKL